MGKNIVVVGSSNTDMIIKVPWIPKPGETILGGRFSTAPGGKGANQAVAAAAARAGGDVTFIARIGDDMFGQKAKEGFIKDKINVDYVLTDESEPSGVALICVDEDGENIIAVASGANSNLSPSDVKNQSDVISSADILLMQLETPLETIHQAASIASGNGVKVILNPAPAQELSDDLLSLK
jgi:ribokinase